MTAAAASLAAGGMVAGASLASAAPADPPADPDFGPNVFIYDPTTPAATIQAKFDDLFAKQSGNQFGTDRYAILLKPGKYNFVAKLGYYTTLAGLGQSPDDTDITGAVSVVGQPDPTSAAGISALENFWRSAENLAVTPTDWSNQWAVSQAAPMRRVHVKGILWLEPGNGGFASGGYLADCEVDGITINGSQQQWITRNSVLTGAWTNGVWNQVFSGVTGAPAADYPTNPYTVLATSPVTREKPYLYITADGAYRVFLPALRHNTSGTTWGAGKTEAGSSIPLSDFYIAKPTDTTAQIQTQLDRGKDLILTPGIYHLDKALHVKLDKTIVIGLGMPTLTPDNGTAAITVDDVDGFRLSGVVIDAGPVESPVLLEVGQNGHHGTHTADPSSLQDVFFRIGGPWIGKAVTTLVVHADDTIIDDVWAWRADHGAGAAWTVNTANTGLVVNGDDVTAYGLFVEHYQQYQTVWNGERGRTIFYQSEMPYDPPSQAAWTSPTGLGYASYKVADSVAVHEAWGLGVYCFFSQGIDILAARGLEVPKKPRVRMHDMVTVFLTGNGGIEKTINDAGVAEVGTFGTSYVPLYPVPATPPTPTPTPSATPTATPSATAAT